MKSTVILAAILADLQTYATTLKGKCDMRSVLAKDPFHAMEILCAAPTGHYLVIQDDGDAENPGHG